MHGFYKTIWKLGEISGCHQNPERSFFIHNKQFPVCARCTGAFIGYIVGAIVYPWLQIPILTALFFCVLMFVDWLLQRLNILTSTNLRRVITGFLCGFSLIQLYSKFIIFIVNCLTNTL